MGFDDDEQDIFAELTSGVDLEGIPDAEEQARRFLGNEQYEKAVAHNDAINALVVMSNAAVVDLQRERVGLTKAKTNAIKVATVFGALFVARQIFR